MEKLLVILVLGISASMAVIPLLDSYINISLNIDSVKVRMEGESLTEYIDEGLMEILNLDELAQASTTSE
ncbi:hypothetical protein [Pleomorphovibrio marinus]|uniref:hypothetical protein n=1 Tax=Pleomorphovibrio marinus TaxID=2164132 RepID=UPI000E0C68E4|nr:hypothetical protein [Pleomorphovibrio marinus]